MKATLLHFSNSIEIIDGPISEADYGPSRPDRSRWRFGALVLAIVPAQPASARRAFEKNTAGRSAKLALRGHFDPDRVRDRIARTRRGAQGKALVSRSIDSTNVTTLACSRGSIRLSGSLPSAVRCLTSATTQAIVSQEPLCP
jgi:hypothetical protein